VTRLPQPNPYTHCIFNDFKWAADEANVYLAGSNKVPRDITTTDESGKCLKLWFFDGSGTGGTLPALELEPKPMLAEFPALCNFDTTGEAVPEAKRAVALISSTFLSMVNMGGNKVQSVLRDGGQVGSFTTTEAKIGTQMS